MNCEANGCTAALTPKPLPGSAMGGPSPWMVTDIPPGWCVRQVENTDVGSSRVVVLCPLHGAGIVPVAGGESARDLLDEVRRGFENGHLIGFTTGHQTRICRFLRLPGPYDRPRPGATP